jgi:TPP-dependent pyruvate/acetoin dehydrogenase alpha subunit
LTLARQAMGDDSRALALERAAEGEMDEAVRVALEAPYPDPSAVLEDIYA